MEAYKWSRTASSNNSAVPDGAPDGWVGANVNEWGRETMAAVRTALDDASFIDQTYQLTTVGTKSLTRMSTTQFKILSCDATAYFTANRRIRVVGATTDHGFVTSSSYSAPDTTVNVTMDSGDVPTSPTRALVHTDAYLRSAAYKKTGSGNGLDADTVDGLHATSFHPRGLFIGRISYTSASTVTIGRGYNQKIYADLDGTLVESSSDLTVDLASADREDVSEASSTWYYLYLYSNSGVMTEKISSTAPVMDPASGKVGYHPTNTTWRCIGAVYNNASSNIQPFDVNADGWFMFRSLITTSPFYQSLSDPTTIGANYVAASNLSLPATARAVRLNVYLRMDNSGNVYYCHDTLIGTAIASNPTPYWMDSTTSGSNSVPSNLTFDMPVDSTPRIGYGADGGGASFGIHELRVIGWRDDFGL